ncbi:MAG TPA: thioredoxin-like domain-containing protein, partial [Acidimicrobiia bacterium]|nr:thioredoxin-like domain-containing protein [Acidimicrobiia bacterium]
MRRTTTALALTLSLLAVSCASETGEDGAVLTPDATAPAGEYTGRSYAGTTAAPEFPDGLEWLNVSGPLSLAALRGKVVLLDFWTYGCINCIHIIPDLERLEAEYPDELVVIGVHSAKFTNEGDTDNIRNVIARYGLEHPVVNDRDFAVWDRWGVNAWPTVVLIDPAGNIVGGHSGEGIYPIFQPVIDALVEEFDFRGTLDRTPLELAVPAARQTVLSFPGKVHSDPSGETLFVADTNHHRILVVDAATGRVTDVAGSGAPGYAEGGFDEARFDQPQGMALSADGSILYVADLGNHAVRALDLDERTVTTLAGTGEQSPVYPPRAGDTSAVVLSSPWDLLLVGDVLHVAMAGSHQLWGIDLASGEAVALAGSGREGVGEGAALEVALAQPSGLAADPAGNVYWADAESSSIRVLHPDGTVSLLAGSADGLFDFGLRDGSGDDVRFQHPLGVAFADGRLFVA